MKAFDLLQRNASIGEDSVYFQIYPNNIPIALFRYILYCLVPFHSSRELFIVDHAVCLTALNIGIFYSWKVVSLLLGRRMGTVFLLLVLSCAPIFFYTLYFYSDTLMIMMPPLLLYIWLRYEQRRRPKDVILFCCLLAAGCVLRQNLILFLPAVVLYLVLRSKLKTACTIGTSVIIILMLMQGATSSLSSKVHIDAMPQYKMPTTHWIMLGLSEQGRYNIRDFKKTFEQPTQAQKKATNLREIKHRLTTRTVCGLLYLWLLKAFRVYADGSMGYYWYMGNTTGHSLMYNYFFGGQKQLVLFMVQIFHCFHFMLLFGSVMRFFRLKKVDVCLLIQIMLFGNYLFYIFVWEAEPRYALLFLFPMLIGSCYGLKELVIFVQKIRMHASLTLPWVDAQRGANLLFVVFLCLAVAHLKPITQNPDVQYHYSVNQSQKKGSIYARISERNVVRQTFHAGRNFDHIALGKAASGGRASYQAAISPIYGTEPEPKTKKIISEKDLEKDRLSEIVLDRQLPGKRDYQLTISKISGKKDAFLDLSIHGKGLFEQRDLYLDGALIQDAHTVKGKDLQFRVYKKVQKPYLNVGLYFFLLSFPLAELIIFADVYRNPEANPADLHPDPV
ncbi:glycosyltransferase family 39 protein [Sporolactobacillus shoreicorticis]|uniref:Glycosyltransferase family 39 protein n=1 Tax=Sporolactobacillus shoreicorticis TaxID=1923877 RepID=A0ABW5S7T4_9BACL|nr:glycosyltransferase family 39 protein [Sporolactobacillus shoreicorticis]MCO7125661.1 glycosyltransferase family 39 protein [Sporolactobacillus shoreicorticis]